MDTSNRLPSNQPHPEGNYVVVDPKNKKIDFGTYKEGSTVEKVHDFLKILKNTQQNAPENEKLTLSGTEVKALMSMRDTDIKWLNKVSNKIKVYFDKLFGAKAQSEFRKENINLYDQILPPLLINRNNEIMGEQGLTSKNLEKRLQLEEELHIAKEDLLLNELVKDEHSVEQLRNSISAIVKKLDENKNEYNILVKEVLKNDDILKTLINKESPSLEKSIVQKELEIRALKTLTETRIGKVDATIAQHEADIKKLNTLVPKPQTFAQDINKLNIQIKNLTSIKHSLENPTTHKALPPPIGDKIIVGEMKENLRVADSRPNTSAGEVFIEELTETRIGRVDATIAQHEADIEKLNTLVFKPQTFAQDINKLNIQIKNLTSIKHFLENPTTHKALPPPSGEKIVVGEMKDRENDLQATDNVNNTSIEGNFVEQSPEIPLKTVEDEIKQLEEELGELNARLAQNQQLIKGIEDRKKPVN